MAKRNGELKSRKRERAATEDPKQVFDLAQTDHEQFLRAFESESSLDLIYFLWLCLKLQKRAAV